MGEEIAFENGRISDFQGLVTLTLTLHRVILHTISCITRRPLPTYQISSKSKKLFVDGRTDVRTGGRTFETHFIRSTQRSRPKIHKIRFSIFVQACTRHSIGLITCHRGFRWATSASN